MYAQTDVLMTILFYRIMLFYLSIYYGEKREERRGIERDIYILPFIIYNRTPSSFRAKIIKVFRVSISFYVV